MFSDAQQGYIAALVANMRDEYPYYIAYSDFRYGDYENASIYVIFSKEKITSRGLYSYEVPAGVKYALITNNYSSYNANLARTVVNSFSGGVVNVPVINVFNKCDIGGFEDWERIYKTAGFKVFTVSAESGEGIELLKKELKNFVSAFTGNSGVGKSSILNALFGEMKLETGAVSDKLGRGRHTTRHVELFKLKNGAYIADTPGFSTFETNKYDIILKDDLADCFNEFADFDTKCRFQDCSHTKEKGCAVIEAVNNGVIPRSRYDSYVEMYEEAKQIKEWEIKDKL